MDQDPVDDDRLPMTPAELREMEAEFLETAPLPPLVVTKIAPPEEIRVMVLTLMELLASQRDAPFFYGAGVRDRFDAFMSALWESGFNFNVTRDRQARAAEQRRLGERAEAGGNLAGALALYDLALASWAAVGCRRRRDRLREIVRVSET